MRVRIDHSRHAGVAAQIDDLRSRWNCPVRVDTLNFVVLDDDDGIGDDAVSVPQLSELHGFDRRSRVEGGNKREGEHENVKTKRRNAWREPHLLSSNGLQDCHTTSAKARRSSLTQLTDL